MAYAKVGFNMGSQGDRTNWGNLVRDLDAAGIPAVCMSNGGEGVGDITAKWELGSTVPHVAVVRYMPTDGSQDVPLYGANIQTAVNEWLNWYAPLIRGNIVTHHQRIITKHGNELDQNEIEWLSQFYTALHPALLARMGWAKHRICCFNFASGEPEPDKWERPQTLNFLRLAGNNPDKFVIGLHEYSYEDTLEAGYPHKIGRFKQLFAVCDEYNIPRPHVAMHEFGWRQESVPAVAVAMEQLDKFAAPLYSFYPEVLGVGIWTLQPWSNSCMPRCVQRLIDPVRLLTLTNDYPTDPDPPIPELPKIVIVIKPQKAEMSELENQQVGQWCYQNYGRTNTHSLDDCLTMLAGGNEQSYAVVAYPNRESQVKAIAALNAAGYAWITLPF